MGEYKSGLAEGLGTYYIAEGSVAETKKLNKGQAPEGVKGEKTNEGKKTNSGFIMPPKKNKKKSGEEKPGNNPSEQPN